MIEVAAFYRFFALAAPHEARRRLDALGAAEGVLGTVILAREGVNATIAGPRAGLEAVISAVAALPGCGALDVKWSTAPAMPFRRLKIRVKPEIVTLGATGADPLRLTGARVSPEDWGGLLDDPDTAVIDCRNDYEVEVGRFEGAIDPGTEGFRDFPAWWSAAAPQFAGKRIAMYCTGGIRCEKASAWLLGQGVGQVLQLDGGVLRYLERVAPRESRWRGECFVFDARVAIGHGLAQGTHSLCHDCGRAVSPEGRQSPDWRPGVSCPACVARYGPADRARFAERERQSRLATARGGRHLGPR